MKGRIVFNGLWEEKSEALSLHQLFFCIFAFVLVGFFFNVKKTIALGLWPRPKTRRRNGCSSSAALLIDSLWSHTSAQTKQCLYLLENSCASVVRCKIQWKVSEKTNLADELEMRPPSAQPWKSKPHQEKKENVNIEKNCVERTFRTDNDWLFKKGLAVASPHAFVQTSQSDHPGPASGVGLGLSPRGRVGMITERKKRKRCWRQLYSSNAQKGAVSKKKEKRWKLKSK